MNGTYKEERKTFYNQVENFWANIDGVEYATLSVSALNKKQVESARKATTRILPVFQRMMELVRTLPDETLLELGYPKESLSFLRLDTNDVPNVIGRFDIMFDGDDAKIIEFNADTPTFIRELFDVSERISKHFDVKNLNKGQSDVLKDVMEKAILSSKEKTDVEEPFVLFVAHKESVEDYETVRYLSELVSDVPGIEVGLSPLEDLEIVPKQGLYLNGKKIDILYRQTWATEIIIKDKEGNVEIGRELLRLVEDGLIQFINPPASFLLQNKMIFALMWSLLKENNPILDESMKEAIRLYIPESYFYEEEFSERNNKKYVEKPVFGREGNSVTVFQKENMLFEAVEKEFKYMPQLFQEYINPNIVTIETEKGIVSGNLVYGVFVLGLEHSSAIGARFTEGNGITDNNALFVTITEE